MDLYPLKFKPIYKERLWGGQAISEKFFREIPKDTLIGESWELSDHKGDESEIINGSFAGKTLRQLISQFPLEIIGKESADELFPLLIKLLDPKDKLSVQVHPDDETALSLEGMTSGKTEMWFVLEASVGASVICGLNKDVTKEELEKHIENNTLEQILNKVPVAQNDVIFIPAGTVHAILPGMLLLEVQQTSDVTYRLYDWGRVDKKTNQPRELHVEKGLLSSDLSKAGVYKHEAEFLDIGDGNKLAPVLSCEHFAFDRLHVGNQMSFSGEGTSFCVIFCLSEKVEISYAENKSMELKYGELVLMPAALKDYVLKGKDAEVAVIYREK